jgi:nitrous oxidase accessory protein NosD
MKNSKDKYQRIIATKEKSAGNESVGSMWSETKSFDRETPISSIIEWAENADGKLIITIDEDTVEETGLSF